MEGPRRGDLNLTQYEQAILQDLVFPDDINVSFEDIGGLSHIIERAARSRHLPPNDAQSVLRIILTPLRSIGSATIRSAWMCTSRFSRCSAKRTDARQGKTMLAKALAHESGACFINLHISTLTEKWFGDSNKLVNAVFTLARKLEPAIVFIDEIDAVLGTRRSGETRKPVVWLRAEFMTHWDGLASTSAFRPASAHTDLGRYKSDTRHRRCHPPKNAEEVSCLPTHDPLKD